jgi:uncharacterized Zn finger protein
MARELVADKARRYLCEGRVIVIDAGKGHVTATVRGDGAVWFVAYEAGLWSCTCPNRTPCVHRRAVRLVTAPDLEEIRP